MGHIFVSYSRHDLEVVDCIVGKFENAGMRVWIDRDDIKAGKTWRAQIVQAIDTCDAFVLMLSSNSADSDNVRKEIDLAQDSGRTVFIMRLDSVIKLPAEMRYQLVGLQYIDIQTLGVDEGVNQLIDTLHEQLATSEPVEEQSVRQAEIVIQGVDPSKFGAEKQEQLRPYP
jgi:TIR domain